MTTTPQEIEAQLNSYTGDNIWQDVIYDLLSEEWEAVNDGGSNDSFVRSGVEYHYDVSTDRWVARRWEDRSCTWDLNDGYCHTHRRFCSFVGRTDAS